MKKKSGAASSARAAELLASSGAALPAFGFLRPLSQAPQAIEDVDDASLDSDVQLALKKLSKRDPTTKTKALAELRGMLASKPREVIVAMLPHWRTAFLRLAMDNARQVREQGCVLLGELAKLVKKELAPHLKALFGAWWMLHHDPAREVAAAAAAALQGSFPGVKRDEALAFCAEEAVGYAEEQLRLTAQTMSDFKTTPAEEAEERYERVTASCLAALAALLDQLPEAGFARAGGRLLGLLEADAGGAGPVRRHEKDKAAMPRRALYGCLAAYARRYGEAGLGPHLPPVAQLVLGAFAEREAACHGALWEAVLTLCSRCPAAWRHVNPRKTVFPRLLALLRAAGYGSAGQTYPALLPFVAALPAEVAGGGGFTPLHAELFDALWAGAASEHLGPAQRPLLLRALADCLGLLLARAADAAAPDAGLLRGALEGVALPLAGHLLLAPAPALPEGPLADALAAALAAAWARAAPAPGLREALQAPLAALADYLARCVASPGTPAHDAPAPAPAPADAPAAAAADGAEAAPSAAAPKRREARAAALPPLSAGLARATPPLEQLRPRLARLLAALEAKCRERAPDAEREPDSYPPAMLARRVLAGCAGPALMPLAADVLGAVGVAAACEPGALLRSAVLPLLAGPDAPAAVPLARELVLALAGGRDEAAWGDALRAAAGSPAALAALLEALAGARRLPAGVDWRREALEDAFGRLLPPALAPAGDAAPRRVVAACLAGLGQPPAPLVPEPAALRALCAIRDALPAALELAPAAVAACAAGPEHVAVRAAIAERVFFERGAEEAGGAWGRAWAACERRLARDGPLAASLWAPAAARLRRAALDEAAGRTPEALAALAGELRACCGREAAAEALTALVPSPAEFEAARARGLARGPHARAARFAAALAALAGPGALLAGRPALPAELAACECAAGRLAPPAAAAPDDPAALSPLDAADGAGPAAGTFWTPELAAHWAEAAAAGGPAAREALDAALALARRCGGPAARAAALLAAPALAGPQPEWAADALAAACAAAAEAAAEGGEGADAACDALCALLPSLPRDAAAVPARDALLRPAAGALEGTGPLPGPAGLRRLADGLVACYGLRGRGGGLAPRESLSLQPLAQLARAAGRREARAGAHPLRDAALCRAALLAASDPAAPLPADLLPPLAAACEAWAAAGAAALAAGGDRAAGAVLLALVGRLLLRLPGGLGGGAAAARSGALAALFGLLCGHSLAGLRGPWADFLTAELARAAGELPLDAARSHPAVRGLYPLLLSPSPAAQRFAFGLLRRMAREENEARALVPLAEAAAEGEVDVAAELREAEEEERGAHLDGLLAPELVRLLEAGPPPPPEADEGEEPEAAALAARRGYLLAWDLVLEELAGGALRGRRRELAACLRSRRQRTVTPFLAALFDHIPPPGREAAARGGEGDPWGPLPPYATELYARALAVLPAAVRAWWTDDVRDRQRAGAVERHTTAGASGRLVGREMAAIAEAHAAARFGPDFRLRGSVAAREVTATYVKDEAAVEVVLRLPPAYPLRPVAVESSKRVGVPEGRWRKWLLAMTTLVANQDGSLLEAVALWKEALDRQFEGVEECPICYQILHVTNHALPRLACKTCRHKFHSACLYKWFSTSHKSECPLCKTAF